jgi:modulator of FtsH protease
MNETPTLRPELTVARERSAVGVFGWVMGLVALALGFLALGSYLGRDFSRGAALTCSLVGLGMLLVQAFGGERFRRGSFAMGWLFALATMIGLGLGSVIASFAEFNRDALAQAIAGTAATVFAMAALGLFLSKDLAPWMKPITLTAFVVFGIAIVWSLVAGPLPAFMSLLIYGIFALLLVVDFNYLRKHGTEDDAIWLATGIFVSIVNIFTALLSLFSD